MRLPHAAQKTIEIYLPAGAAAACGRSMNQAYEIGSKSPRKDEKIIEISPKLECYLCCYFACSNGKVTFSPHITSLKLEFKLLKNNKLPCDNSNTKFNS